MAYKYTSIRKRHNKLLFFLALSCFFLSGIIIPNVNYIVFLLVIFLSRFLYIGARDYENRVYYAAKSIASKTATQEQIQKAAAEHGVSAESVSLRRGTTEFEGEPKHYVAEPKGLYEATIGGEKWRGSESFIQSKIAQEQARQDIQQSLYQKQRVLAASQEQERLGRPLSTKEYLDVVKRELPTQEQPTYAEVKMGMAKQIKEAEIRAVQKRVKPEIGLREEVQASLFKKLGYDVKAKPGEVRAVMGEREIISTPTMLVEAVGKPGKLEVHPGFERQIAEAKVEREKPFFEFFKQWRSDIRELKPEHIREAERETERIYKKTEKRVSKGVKGILPAWKPEWTRKMEAPAFGEPIIKVKLFEDVKAYTRKGVVRFGKGVYTGIREEPIKMVATAATFAILPGGLAAVGKVTKGIRAFKAAKVIEKGIEYALPFAYGASVGLRVAAEPTFEKRMERLGRISITEVVPMGVGTVAGMKALKKVWGRGTKVPIEKMVSRDVLTGKKIIYARPKEEHLKSFEEAKPVLPGEKPGEHVFHLTPKKLGDPFEVIPRGREITMLSVAPGDKAALHFARMMKTRYELFRGGLFPEIGTPPTFARFKTTAMREIPSDFKATKTLKELQEMLPGYKFDKRYLRESEYMLTKVKSGEAIVTKIKDEVEAGMVGKYKQILSDYKTKYKGTEAYIDLYDPFETKPPRGVIGAFFKKEKGRGVTFKVKDYYPDLPAKRPPGWKKPPAYTELVPPGELPILSAQKLAKRLAKRYAEYKPPTYRFKPYLALLPSYYKGYPKKAPYVPYKPSRPYIPPYKPPKVPSYITPYKPPKVPYIPRPTYVKYPTYKPPTYKPPYIPPYTPPYYVPTPPRKFKPTTYKPIKFPITGAGLMKPFKIRVTKRKYKYRPSLVALAERIYAKKPSKLMEEGRLTGLFVRPIPLR